MLCFFYALVYFATVAGRNLPKPIYAVSMGFLVFAGSIAFGGYTGAGFNVVRNFGPSLVTGRLEDGIIFWLASFGGGCLGGFYYKDSIIDKGV